MNSITIDGKAFSVRGRTMVIAEIGVNHDGSVERALEMVNIAAGFGADAVKMQVFQARKLMHGSSSFAGYQQDRTDAKTPSEMLKKYELTARDLRKIVDSIRQYGMIPLATPFSPTDVVTIAQLELPAIKIASPDAVNRPLLARAAKLGKPMLVSTGAATIEEIEMLVSWLREWKTDFALLHCVSSYPTPPESANLCWIGELANRFDVPVGYSDHTTDLFSGALAVASGAAIIEKHLTYDTTAAGPDHAASADPDEFAEYVQMIRSAEVMRGAGSKRVLEIEKEIRIVSRQSLVVQRSIKAGETLREEDLTVQRPGTGIPASKISEAIGKKISKAIKAGSMLQWDMLEAA